MTIPSDIAPVPVVVDIRAWIDHPAWMTQAACRGLQTKAFYPVDAAGLKVPKRVCRGCPVRGDCLDYAMINNEAHGVWGGTSERQRRRLRRQLNLPTEPTPRQIRHGTTGGYQAHLRRGDPACCDCLHAHAMDQHYTRPSRAQVTT